MSNNQQNRGDSIETYVNPKTGTVRTRTSGPNAPKNHKIASWRTVLCSLVVLAAGMGLGYLLHKGKKKVDTKSTTDIDNNKTDNEIRTIHEKTEDAAYIDTVKTKNDVYYDNAHTDNRIRIIAEEAKKEEAKTKELGKRIKANKRAKQKAQCIKPQRLDYNTKHPFANSGLHSFCDWFLAKHGQLPELPPLTDTLITGRLPYGFDIPALFTILSVLGAFCFSSLRAKYHGAMQSPTILVVIEGPSGCGKSLFHRIYLMLAQRFIEHDEKYLNAPKDSELRHFIQFLSVKTTRSRFVERLSNNKEVYTFMFGEEIDSAKDTARKKVLGDEFIRLSFDNALFEYDTSRKDVPHGFYHIYNNFVFTGTPQTVNNFINGKVENGEASRIIWCDVPKISSKERMFNEPDEAKMKAILDELDTYQKKYTYYTESSGNEVRCPDYEIDLEYVQDALDEWVSKQEELGEKVGQAARLEHTGRISTIAFRCAMILCALWGFPEDAQTRRKVVTLTLYIADYIMERYVYKFGQFHNDSSLRLGQYSPKASGRIDIPDSQVADWVRRNKVLGSDGKPKEGYGTFAKEWKERHPGSTVSKDTVKRRMKEYREQHPDV